MDIIVRQYGNYAKVDHYQTITQYGEETTFSIAKEPF
jgi:hypothetical protein